MLFHQDWYQQRYQSNAKLSKRINKKEQEKIALAELIFQECAISYETFGNTCICITLESEEIYFFPLTNKWKVNEQFYSSRSPLDFIEKVVRYRNTENYQSRLSKYLPQEDIVVNPSNTPKNITKNNRDINQPGQ